MPIITNLCDTCQTDLVMYACESLSHKAIRRYCQLPVSRRRMQRFLRFRLGCHGLPIATGRLAGASHVGRADRVCLACNSGGVGDEKHMIFECTALAPLRQLCTERNDSCTRHSDPNTLQGGNMLNFAVVHLGRFKRRLQPRVLDAWLTIVYNAV